MPDWIFRFPEIFTIDIKEPIDNAIDYMKINWDPFFDGLASVLRSMLNVVGIVVENVPWWFLLVLVFFATFKLYQSLSKALLYAGLMFFIGAMGYWSLMNQTLTIVICSVIISLIIGFPLGVLISFSKKSNTIVRPILDTMQTMPSFVYLIPAVMFMGIGQPPAVIATTIYAIPPIVRLTYHGIQQVNSETVEASKAFGSTKLQTLVKVQIPQALPTIMTGVNQTIMMAIAMVVTCSMIGAKGLGSEVITGINRLESGRGFVAGTSIVIMAIVIDRLTQGIFKKDGDPE